MRVQTTKKALEAALTLLGRVIPTRSSNPLITAVEVRSNARGLTLSGTNLDVDMQVELPGEVALGGEDARFTVPAHLWLEMVKHAGGNLIELERHGTELAMRSAGSDVKLQTSDGAEYPPLTFSRELNIALSGADLRRALESVRYAVSSQAFQAVFRGVLLEFAPHHTRAVASDGFRLAFTDLPGYVATTQRAIIPGRSLDQVLPALKTNGDVSLRLGDGVLLLHAGDVRLNVKLLDGDFPDYERAMPKQVEYRASFPAATLRESLERVSVMSDSNANHRVTLTIDHQDGRLQSENDYGRAQDVLGVSSSSAAEGEAFSINFNAGYLKDALNGCSGEVHFAFSGRISPALLTSTGEPGHSAVVVPLRDS